MKLKEHKKLLADNVYLFLKNIGFRRSGTTFELTKNDLTYLLQIQSSQSSTEASYKLTVNVCIVSLRLCELEEIEKPNYLDSHWRKRIGFYLDEPLDKWWIVDSQRTMEQASKEIIALLENKVLPDMFSFTTTKDLEKLWLEGKCEGLTEVQRKYNLELLGA